ncbi:MAG: ParB/RepB/Spo0J family partition protein [bacterium]|nr:ParB/RepB/Spo0J family partition protein [bacterium]
MHKALGKGLEALIPGVTLNDGDVSLSESITHVKLDNIVPNKYQARHYFNEQKIRELAASIQTNGLVHPLLVRRLDDGYELIAGERRWRAAKEAGLADVPAIVKEVNDAEMFELSLIENIQREDLNPLEEAEAYRQLMDNFNLSQEKLSQRIGKDRSSVANMLRLLKLPDEVKTEILNGNISAGHARAIMGLESLEDQESLAQRISGEKLSVREAEEVVKKLRKISITTTKQKNVHIIEAEEELQRALGAHVNIKYRKGKGKIEVKFYSDTELERIMNVMKGIR